MGYFELKRLICDEGVKVKKNEWITEAIERMAQKNHIAGYTQNDLRLLKNMLKSKTGEDGTFICMDTKNRTRALINEFQAQDSLLVGDGNTEDGTWIEIKKPEENREQKNMQKNNRRIQEENNINSIKLRNWTYWPIEQYNGPNR